MRRVFVEALDLADLGFDGVQPLATGRPALIQQISFTDPDSRSMATSARGSGTVGYKRFALWSGHCARVVGS
jgi:hypothetical protein